MGKSAGEVTVVESRTLRRKLTQSTLFPNRQQESSAEKGVEVRCEENVSDDEDFEHCGSQGRKKRKAKGKATRRPKSAKKNMMDQQMYTNGKDCLNGMTGNQDSPVLLSIKKPRKPEEKQQSNSTPKKARVNNSREPTSITVRLTSPLPTDGKTNYIPNLRSEAKLSAEENSRIFSGKQLHPFFSSRSSCKVIRDTTEAKANCGTSVKRNDSKSLGPIHVFESDQDRTPVLDWRNWMFIEKSLFTCNQAHEMINYVAPGSCTESDKYFKISCTSSSPPPANGVAGGHPAENSSLHPVLTDENLGGGMGRIGVCSNHAGHSEYGLDEKNSSILRIRNQGLNSLNKYVLWTKKYQPERATEVCGNCESVKNLSEWLQLWHAKALQCREPKNTSDSSDHDYFENDCDSEPLSQGEKLKNVLLIIGPTGSGKSASIYACAKEQGFHIIEVNTSDWRNGALVKQKFGEAVESHNVIRMNENEASPSIEQKSDCSDHHMSQEAENEAEMINVAIQDDTSNLTNLFAKVPCARSKLLRDMVQLKTLVLFEDVDITFTDDRGFISAIQHLARTAKLPIILTTNSNQTILPDSLDRAEIYFSRPSPKDLLGHVIEICCSEKANIEPSAIQNFIEVFDGDIRKTIMHLQFWCQSTASIRDKNMQEIYASQVFDLNTAHRLLMKLIPWGFASELSELIELEVNKTLNLQEECSTLIEVNVENHLSASRQHGFQMHQNKDRLASQKDAMLQRNTHHGYGAFEAELETQDLSYSSGSPVMLSRRNSCRKSAFVLSSSEDDEMYDNECPVTSAQEATHLGYCVIDYGCMPCIPKPANNFSPPRAAPYEPGEHFESQILDLENSSHIQDSCGVFDLSCVPESSFVAETRINDERDESCRSVSYVPSSDMINTISSGNKSQENLTAVEVECFDECLSRLYMNSHNVVNTSDINDHSIHTEDVGDSHTEHVEVATRQWQIMDECSQMNFNRYKTIHQNVARKNTDSVQEAWARLRETHQDLGKYVTSKQKYASQFLKVTSGASNLISDADIMLTDFWLAKHDSAEPSTISFEESGAFQWYDEQLHMTSTFSHHGLSFYAKEATEAVIGMDQTCLVDSEQEMLTFSTDKIILQKVVAKGFGITELLPQETSDSAPRSNTSEREPKFSRQDIVRSIVPPRSYLAVRGEALHEYVSSLNIISRSETSRLLAGVDKGKRRRRCRGPHYLNSGELSLSSEDISLLDRRFFVPHCGDA